MRYLSAAAACALPLTEIPKTFPGRLWQFFLSHLFKAPRHGGISRVVSILTPDNIKCSSFQVSVKH